MTIKPLTCFKLFLLIAVTLLQSCGGGDSTPPATYTIGGTVSGLAGSGLVLQNNSGDDLSISADGSFTFATAIDDATSYSVSVLTQPSSPTQTCSVSNASGTLAGANITNVSISCTTLTYTIGGTVSGLTGSGLVLQNNLGDDEAINADGSFTFTTALDDLSGYSVSVSSQPGTPNQECTVSNASGALSGANVTNVSVVCSGSNAIVHFVSPTHTTNIISHQIRIHTTGLTAAANEVYLQPSTGGDLMPLPFSTHSSSNNVILATLPSGLATGSWNIFVRDNNSLDAVLNDGIVINDTVSIDIAGLSVSKARNIDLAGISTMTISNQVNNDLELTAGTTSFSQGTKIYLQKDSDTAIELLNQYYLSPYSIHISIPSGTPTGTYNLIAADNNGAAGILIGGLTVSDIAKPAIERIYPSTLQENLASASLSLTGKNFDTSSTPAITLLCKNELGAVTTTPGTNINVNSTSTISVDFDTTSLSAPLSCNLNLVNSEGMSTTSKSLSVLNSSLNAGSWASSPANQLQTARNSPAVITGSLSPEKEYMYVIGGDDTNKTTPFSSIESTQIGLQGELGTWQTEFYNLSVATTFSTAINIGRFIYLVGGHTKLPSDDVTTNAVLKAFILSMDEAPAVNDYLHEINPLNSGGLDVGNYLYRVSATFGGSFFNPNGESAVGRPIEVPIPDITGTELTIKWNQIPGASGYRIYRSPVPNSHFDSLELIGTTTGATSTQFVDTGLSTTASPVLHEGNLGRWHPVTNMSIAREGHAVAVSPDPDEANKYYIYALGGRDNNGNYLSSYSYSTVTINSETIHLVSSWTNVSSALTARGDLESWLVNGNDSSAITAGEYWLFAGPGRNDTNSYVNDVDAFKVNNDGSLASAISVGTVTGNAAGYSVATGTDKLYLFGGQNGASSTMRSTAICITVSCQTWNSDNSLSTPRINAGHTNTNGEMYVIGGTDDMGNAISAVERATK